MKVTKAVFPVAGLGTRFLPATKATPKEMLPIVDKPLIQHAVEEAIAAGVTFAAVRQPEALGLGHAVLCARDLVGDEPFAVLLPDDLIDAEVPALKQMVDVQAKRGGSVVAVQNVERRDTASYGIVSAQPVAPRLAKMSAIVEKPKPEEAPSTLGVVGRYVLSARIFQHLENLPRGAGREIQLTDGIGRLLREEDVFAYEFEGHRYDCGSKLGYLKATVNYALKHPEVSGGFGEYLKAVAAGKRGP